MGSAESKPSESTPTEGSRTKSIKPYGHTDNATSIKLNSSHRALYDGVVSLIEKNKYSDLLVICGSDRYPVHRAIVCPRSTWFEHRCEQVLPHIDFSSPASSMKIWLDQDEEPHIIAAVLTFLYTLDYADSGPQFSFGLPYDQSSLFSRDSDTSDTADAVPQPPEDEGTPSSTPTETTYDSHATMSREDSPLLTPTASPPPENASAHTAHADPGSQANELLLHAKMCLAGHRFGIPPLLEVAKEKFERQLKADTWKAEMLPCIYVVERHQGSHGIVQELRVSLLKSAKRRWGELKQMTELKKLIVECPEFMANLMKIL
ncbi:hypothetical protein AOQ84DRAFT_380628 [Glonium stellatum]|uniref:BTB domain-containing protein n=1 Tax=Glonium stellatum TaxID=574774 RepID=A0A8E2JP67_9PEZI|nr:hypothetical protein AOQ84DRAFT_380628 [Glonium stellatum]